MLQYTLKRIIVIITVILLIASGVRVYAHWAEGIKTPLPSSISTEIIVGEFTLNTHPPFDTEDNYNVGDTFVYDNKVWIVTQSWFNPYLFLNTSNEVDYNYVRPYGPIEELTNEYRNYNTYYTGDIVNHLGETWVVRHEGANTDAPGTNTNAWNRINNNNYYKYNTYTVGDLVIYNGETYKALDASQNKTPDLYTWAWEKQ